MLTGDIGVTKGDAYINQHSVVDDILAARQSMGYCPQFDALNDLLTAREHLKLYARIRGIQEDDVNQVSTIKDLKTDVYGKPLMHVSVNLVCKF